MKMFRRVRRYALHAAPSCALFFVLGTPSARAQTASLDPDRLPPLPSLGPRDVTVDRAGSDSSRPVETRKDRVSIGALLGTGFPRPLAVEGVVKLERTVLVGLEYSALPSITVSDVRASCWAIAGDLRIFPLRGPFFVGLRAGRQHIAAAALVSAYGYTAPTTLTVDTMFLNPRLGFLWTWDPGITLGIDAGVQIPLGSTTGSTLSTGSTTLTGTAATAASSAQQSLESVAGSFGQTTLPTVDLLRIGILF